MNGPLPLNYAFTLLHKIDWLIGVSVCVDVLILSTVLNSVPSVLWFLSSSRGWKSPV